MLFLPQTSKAEDLNSSGGLSLFIETNITLLNFSLVLLCAWLGYRLLKSRLEILNIGAIDFHALADDAHDGIFIVQNDHLVYANQRAGDILGYPADALLDLQLKDIVHPDDVELVLDRHQRRIRGEDVPKQYEVTFINKHGNKVPVELTATISSWRGRPAGLVIIRDITERRLIEQTLVDSEKRYRSLVENSPDAILIIDAETDSIIEANEQAETLFKLTKQQLFSMAPEELSKSLIDSLNRRPFMEYIDKTLHGLPLIFERNFSNSDDRVFPCEVRLSRMPFPNRKLIRSSIIDITQRKLYQSALAKSEARLANFFQASCEALFFHNKGIILDVNDVVENIFGYKKDEVIGHHLLEYVAPESQEPARQNVSMGVDGPYELTAIRKNGDIFPVQIQAKTLQLDNVSQRVVSVTDLSSLQQVNDKLLASEKRLENIIDNMIDTLYRTDMQGKLVMVSPSSYDLLGYHPQELIDTDVAQLYAKPSGRELFLGALQENNGEISAYEIPMLHKNGEIVWVSTNARFIYDHDEYINGVESISRDITEQRKNKEALRSAKDELELRIKQRTEQLSKKNQELEILQSELRESEQNFRALVENAVDSFFLHDKNGNILDINQHACDSLGYTREELLRLTIMDIEIGSKPMSFTDIHATLEHQQGVQLEGVHRRKDGSTFPVEVNLALLNKANRKLILALVRDITTRKDAENQLIRARHQAEQASQAKSNFLSRMSHELRTPLNAIIGFSELLDSDVTDPLSVSQRENAGEIYTASRHLLNLIDDLLELSTIESGRVKIQTEKVNVIDLAHECIGLIHPLAIGKLITVRHNLDTCPTTCILVDPTRFKQVIINLLSNAIKCSKTGGIVALELSADNAQARITLSDTGPGLTKAQQKRLFLPFECIDNDTDTEGSGNGLNICKHLTELMGGRIGVNRKYRSRSQFWLEYPLAGNEHLEQPVQESADTDAH